MKEAVLAYPNSNNLGDYIQSIAATYCLEASPVKINREQLHTYNGPPVGLIMNGWFMEQPRHWPPAQNITPLFISFHLNPTAKHHMLQDEGIEYLKRHQPIGCRDIYTQRLLERLGIKAYFSACLSLTLKREYFVPQNTERRGILVISVLDRLLPKFRCGESVNTKNLYHDLVQIAKYPRKANQYSSAAKRLEAFLSLQSEPIIRQSQIVDTKSISVEKRIELAEKQLQSIAKAAYVITSRIHTAMPAIAMGTPVLFLTDGLTHINQFSRLEGLDRFVGFTKSTDLTGLAWDELQITKAHLPYSEDMRNRIRHFFNYS